MLSVHPLRSIVPEARCSGIPKLREENVEQHHARITKEFMSAVPDLATALEGRFVGNCGKPFSIRRAVFVVPYVYLLYLMCICCALCVFVVSYVYLLYLICICCALYVFVVPYVYLLYLMCICCALYVFVVP